jgi:hypothetical protein
MARLGEILLAEKVITSKELDAALEYHVMHGVKLGTCLVEMGYVADDVLARCLGKKAGQAFLTRDQLLALGSQNLSVISPVAIKKHRLIPVGMNGGALRIATDHDFSPNKQAELEKFLGREIEPVAVTGYAIDFFLEQMFGIERPGRFLQKFSRKKTPEEAPTVVEKVLGEDAPIDAPFIIDGIEWKSLRDVTQDEEYSRVFEDIFNVALKRDDVPLSLSDAAEHLSHATSRDDVAKTVLDFISNSSSMAALVIANDGVVHGWKAYSNRKILPGFETFSSPLESLPDLQQCVITKKPYFGNAMTADKKLLLQQLHYAGDRIAFFPIFIKQRVIAVLLCDGSEKLNPIETAKLCRNASYALEILVLRSKLLSL